MSTFIVTSTSLNLRSAPLKASGNLIVSLLHQHEVEVLDQSAADWWKVRTEVAGRPLNGFVASRFLTPKAEARVPATSSFAQLGVHLETDPRSRLDSRLARFSPLCEQFARRDIDASPAQRISSIYRIIDQLDVERSARYQRTRGATYCNIYVFDSFYLAGVYMPRVWWRSKALIALSKGDSVRPIYDETVHELNANALHDWLLEWGDDMKWQRVFDLTELQSKVNEGGVGVICAKRRDVSTPGHITCVIPESAGRSAQRVGMAVVAPLQSQAGAVNKKLFASAWWVAGSHNYSSTVFFWHA